MIKKENKNIVIQRINNNKIMIITNIIECNYFQMDYIHFYIVIIIHIITITRMLISINIIIRWGARCYYRVIVERYRDHRYWHSSNNRDLYYISQSL